MKKQIFFYTLMLCLFSFTGYSQLDHGWKCHSLHEATPNGLVAPCPDISDPPSSANGRVLTPKGDMNILIIYAGFTESASSISNVDNNGMEIGGRPLHGWTNDILDNGTFDLPEYLTFESGETSTSTVIFNDVAEFAPGGDDR